MKADAKGALVLAESAIAGISVTEAANDVTVATPLGTDTGHVSTSSRSPEKKMSASLHPSSFDDSTDETSKAMFSTGRGKNLSKL